MDLIKSLTESKLFSSKKSFHRWTGRQLAEMAYLHIISLRIMSCEKITREEAKRYALKTNNHDDFKSWKQNGTDVYLLIHALSSKDIKQHDDTSEHYVRTLHLEYDKITAWLLSISSSNSMSQTRAQRLFSSLDNQFKINDGTYRSIRRLAMNWPDLDVRERQLCFTRLIQIMRQRCQSSDLLPWLEKLSKNNGLELADSEEDGVHSHGTSLAQAAAMHRSIYEDGDAVATTSGDIAGFAKPLGKVRRRNPK